MKNNMVLPIVFLVVGLAAGFGGGYYFKGYQQTQARAAFAGGVASGVNGTRFVGGTRGAGAGARGGAGATTGSILSMDNKSITVKMVDGSTKIVLFSTSTTYSNTVSAAQTDLKVGSTVAVFGTPNSDGSLTATTIQINPAFGRPMSSPIPSGR